jgi:mRNA-degrading endonuclease HigB of HigAB toxin-antitoxin module
MILNYHDFLNETLDFNLNNPEFWEDYNNLLKSLNCTKSFYPYWNFIKKWVNSVLDENELEHAHDRLFVELHNHNIIPKNISFSEKIYMYAHGWGDLTIFLKKEYGIEIDNPMDFIKNKSVTIFRGVPKNYYENLEYLAKNKYKSFTLDKNIALRFTQYGFVGGRWKNESEQKGFIIETDIPFNDIYIYNIDGDEHECIVHGELEYKKIHIVENGEITEVSEITELYSNFINEDLSLKNHDGILLIVDVQKEFGDYIPDNMVKELFEYCKEFKEVYQIWDSHDAVAPTFKFPNQKGSINKKFGKKFLEKDVQNKLEKLKNDSIEGQQIQIDSDDIFVRVKNNHDWFFINDDLLKLFNQLKGKTIILVGGADFECLNDIFVACKSMGIKSLLNHKYIYSAETKKTIFNVS